MSNAKDAAPPVPPAAIVPDKLLDAGEVVILAIKPSVWFVLIDSLPAIAAAVAAAGIAYVLRDYLNLGRSLILTLFAALVLLRLLAAAIQWAGRLYILTNVRMMRIRGVWRADVFQCPLKQIKSLNLSTTVGERLLAVGTLFFEIENSPASETAWLHIAQPTEVHDIVRDTINRARR